MKYDNLIVLIPCHSLEDFPTDVGEDDAAALLNAFAVLWHPKLLKSAGVLPMWHRADAPPEFSGQRLVVVPTACDSWLPGGWVDRARYEGATVVANVSDREEMVRQCLTPLEDQTPVDADIAADFLALGAAYLQIELLTRKMHYFSNLEEVQLQREAVAAAEAACAGDLPAAKTRLKSCFEILTSARERFYPVECYILDLCLLIPRLADEHLERTLESTVPVNFLLTARDLDEIGREKPSVVEKLKAAWEAGRIDIAGGEFAEVPSPLMSISSTLWDFRRGYRIFRRWCGKTPTTWARRRFGLSTLIPQILVKSGYRGALHVALDDGIYPDTEQSRIRWEGGDGSLIDAATRIPLAADPATSYLKFASRMAESMEQDQTAAVLFARWPECESPWFEDLRRTNNYSPCLGRFVTLERYFENLDNPGRLSKYDEKEYFTPYLIQSVARQEKNPISRYQDHLLRRQKYDAAEWCDATSAVLSGRSLEGDLASDIAWATAAAESGGPIAGSNHFERELMVEKAGPDAENPMLAPRADAVVDQYFTDSVTSISHVIRSGGGENAGVLVVNPLSFTRRSVVETPSLETPPAVKGAVKAVQFDETRKSVVVELPPCGFAWIGNGGSASPQPARKSANVLMAEDLVLRNEYFEVHINEATGGVARIKGHGRSPNRLSQQLSYRFSRERTVAGEDGRGERTYYASMRCDGIEVRSNGPSLGEYATRGAILDPQNGDTLATFTQQIRVWRGRPAVDLSIQLEIVKMPDGDPWTNYFASRFAWNDSLAAITRSVQQGAHSFQGERIESPHYLEIAEGEQRTTILPRGLPYHRKTGSRMIDTLLVVAGETRRQFDVTIVTDCDYPMQAALDSMTPAMVAPASGPPRSGETGWLFHVDAKNVQLLRVMGLESGSPAEPTKQGFAVRLAETEGRRKQVKLRTFRTPQRARTRDFQGRTLSDLALEEDAVLIDMSPYEIADVELFF